MDGGKGVSGYKPRVVVVCDSWNIKETVAVFFKFQNCENFMKNGKKIKWNIGSFSFRKIRMLK